jgi:hypothetical protein
MAPWELGRMMKIVAFFLTSRGVRQGDSIFPIFFDFMADVFTKILMKAASTGLLQKYE